ncbi:MAG: hypothetical protein FWE19_00525 [Oscillospiraceae bacterium]|nr:hypothetical protein [Oscillospiraceae bacterium]
MTRKFLVGLGIDAEVVEKIIDANGADIEREKGVAAGLRDDLQKAKDDLATAKADLEKAKQPDSDLEKVKADLEAEKQAHAATKEQLGKDLETEKAAHKTTQDGIAAEKDAAEERTLIAKLLETPGEDGIRMSAAAIPIALKQYDRAVVKRDKGGKIANPEDVLKHFREGDFKDFFGKTQAAGADVGKPPAGGGGGDDGQPKTLRDALAQKYTPKG